MSKYYRAEDIQEFITACTWRMTLAKERNGEGFVEYDKQIIDVSEFRKRLSNLPTIDIVRCGECESSDFSEATGITRCCKYEFFNDPEGGCSFGERIDNE